MKYSYIHEKCKSEYLYLAYVGHIVSSSKCYSSIFNRLFALQSCFIYLEYSFHAKVFSGKFWNIDIPKKSAYYIYAIYIYVYMCVCI